MLLFQSYSPFEALPTWELIQIISPGFAPLLVRIFSENGEPYTTTFIFRGPEVKSPPINEILYSSDIFLVPSRKLSNQSCSLWGTVTDRLNARGLHAIAAISLKATAIDL